VLLTLGTIYVVFFAENFIDPFTSFLITLGVPLAAWAGIMIGDLALRRRDYEDEALFDAQGRYGAFDRVAIGTLVAGAVLGWGLVTNTVAGTSWNDWQGYLLGPLGLGGRDGAWAFANLGVLVALVFSLVVTLIARRSTVARLEAV
jgi:NCS1 family nucleobase:cation symporter-1